MPSFSQPPTLRHHLSRSRLDAYPLGALPPPSLGALASVVAHRSRPSSSSPVQGLTSATRGLASTVAWALVSAARGLTSTVPWGPCLRHRPSVGAFVAIAGPGPSTLLPLWEALPPPTDTNQAPRRVPEPRWGIGMVLNQASKRVSGLGFREI
ncbi:hypothetical protein GUJ93_ZPchr0012g21771 [Zizania palustris]|uniref:Uncharacterized protein n=1 Tax=Zizania palustris TaxID=103762 RepID=A0A8J6BVS4_ZIZPA|nr:hypothetical protein GUJ93_ZPchr0012g21771 [Zizania palustris]